MPFFSPCFKFVQLFLLATLFFISASSVLASSTGEQKTAVLLVNFQGNTTQPITKDQATSLVFGQMSNYYWEASYQHTLISGDTFGWYTLPVAPSCDGGVISTNGRAAASQAGVDLSSYTKFIFIMPGNSTCGWSGTATVGSNEVFLNGNFSADVVIHETGHTFGLRHSNDLSCTDTPILGSCVVREYADRFDAMGNASSGHFNAFQKERLGWLNAPGFPSITTTQASGSFFIAPYETPNLDTKAIKVLQSVNPTTGVKTWYYIEFRQPIGFDANLASIPYTNVHQGVLIHLVTEGDTRSSRLLDMTPHSNSFYDNRNDSALVVGQSFYDPQASLTITTRSANSTGALVDVIYNGAPPVTSCVRNAPTVSASGSLVSVLAGSTINYVLNVKNNDSANCAATTFNLTKIIPLGWTESLSVNSLSLSAGATGTANLGVTSTSSATSGAYQVGAGVTSAQTYNAQTTYTVSSQASSTITQTLATDKTSYARGSTVYMSAKVLNGSAVAVGAQVSFVITSPTGAITTSSAVTGSDGFARSTYKVGKGKTAAGNYAIKSSSTSGPSSATASSTFLVI